MNKFIQEFSKLKELIENGDEENMRSLMRKATSRRMLFDKPKN
jgi:prephenate dehydrogenase